MPNSSLGYLSTNFDEQKILKYDIKNLKPKKIINPNDIINPLRALKKTISHTGKYSFNPLTITSFTLKQNIPFVIRIIPKRLVFLKYIN